MMCIDRMTVTLTLLSLLIPAVSPAGQSQDRAGVSASEKTLTISGQIGVSGVIMRGLPGDPMTDDNGVYATRVRYGWGGIVTPTKEGFAFEPPNRNYTKVIEDQANQDYIAKLLTFTISGNASASGVLMQGLPDSPVTDQNGAYTTSVPYGWAGRVAPYKEGYTFEPVRKEYPRVVANVRNQDYKARARMLTISDTIKIGAEPIAGVKVTMEPGGQSVLTNSQGEYAVQVPYGWSGRLIFSKEGWVFAPDSKSFTDITSDIVGGLSMPPSEWPSYNRSYNRVSATPSRPPVALPAAAGDVFVIPTAQVVPQKLVETADDLRVMLQIFREKLSEPRLIRGAFVNFGDFFSDRDRAQEAFYLQGSAAVFVLEVDAPFSFSPPQTNAGPAAQENVDVVWQRARQKLYSPQDPAGPAGETERMDFQQFQEDLLKTFRHAANLRHMEPNEAVVLMIKARDESAGWPAAPARAGGSFSTRPSLWFEGGSYSSSSGTFGPAGGTSQADSHTYSRGSATSQNRAGGSQPGSAPVSPSAVLTIQARKADIDLFAKGSLSLEQFQQRVKVFTY